MFISQKLKIQGARIALIFGCLMVLSLPAHPATKTITVMGDLTCLSWNAGMPDKPGADIELTWVLGYLTGYNAASPMEYDALHGINAELVRDWIIAYCQKNRAKHLSDAADALFERLSKRFEKRTSQ